MKANDSVRICEGECDEQEFDYCDAAIDRDTINGMDVVMDGGEDRRTLQAWNQLWPRTNFKDRETWLSYCRKWWSKTPELVEILDAHLVHSKP